MSEAWGGDYEKYTKQYGNDYTEQPADTDKKHRDGATPAAECTKGADTARAHPPTRVHDMGLGGSSAGRRRPGCSEAPGRHS